MKQANNTMLRSFGSVSPLKNGQKTRAHLVASPVLTVYIIRLLTTDRVLVGD